MHVLPSSGKFMGSNQAKLPLSHLSFLIMNTTTTKTKTTEIIAVIQIREAFPAKKKGIKSVPEILKQSPHDILKYNSSLPRYRTT